MPPFRMEMKMFNFYATVMLPQLLPQKYRSLPHLTSTATPHIYIYAVTVMLYGRSYQ
ncbi:hypothetical protein Barb7_00958 [Bacteroidales bacterium Barb7]|nr:hypothetical protein Barb7_00958 [Bacteroidales bacterium Barb7]